MKISFLPVSDTMTFSFVGPPLKTGPLPTVFYLALSAKDSLTTDPYNQPVCFLHSDAYRIFTVTLPGHEEERKPEKAFTYLAKQIKEGRDVFIPFFEKMKTGIDYLIKNHLILEGKLGIMGLSRGAFIALHVAARCPAIRFILGFAPQTTLSQTKEFQGGPNVSHLDTKHLIPSLYDRMIRFYIGNLDTRTGTRNAFELISGLAKEANNHRIRSSPIELIIGPSIGYQGHGTAPHVFQAGVDWIKHLWSID